MRTFHVQILTQRHFHLYNTAKRMCLCKQPVFHAAYPLYAVKAEAAPLLMEYAEENHKDNSEVSRSEWPAKK